MSTVPTSEVIGMLGQGWIGRNYADMLEERGHTVVRYSLEPEYIGNRERIPECTIVFIAVPTPTTPEGFDTSAIEALLPLLREGTIAVIKSTILPGTTVRLQEQFPQVAVLHSPEFLRETHAAYDARHPDRTLIGIPNDTAQLRAAAKRVLAVLPPSPYTAVISSSEAELIKYAGNVFLAMKVVYANMLADLAVQVGASYDAVEVALGADPRIGHSHLRVVMESGHGGPAGRGAGGHCFIKDLEAFRQEYARVGDTLGSALLTAIVRKNSQLLVDSGKDVDLLRGVYSDTLELP